MELPVVWVGVIFLILTVAGYVAGWETPFDSGPAAYVRWRVIGSAIELLVWLSLVATLGWWRSSGLVWGSASPWGLVPFLAMSVVMLVSPGDAAATFWAPGLQLWLILGIVVGALQEEVAFRGFLLRGLTRRFGGTLGVLISSAVFAIYHVPWMLIEGLDGTLIEFRLLTHFAFGVVMCRIRADTGSLVWPTAVHVLWNLSVSSLAVWAYPDGRDPAGLAFIGIAIEGFGLFGAWTLLFREAMARVLRDLVSGSWTPRRELRTARESMLAVGSVARKLLAPIPAETFERFSAAARRAIVLANEEARRKRRRATDAEHLLLALIHESDQVAATSLKASGVALGTPGRLDELLEGGTGPSTYLPSSRRFRMVLGLAISEADTRGHDRIGTEHLLLGATAVSSFRMELAFRAAGVRRKRLRRTLIALLSEPGASPADRACSGRPGIWIGRSGHRHLHPRP